MIRDVKLIQRHYNDQSPKKKAYISVSESPINAGLIMFCFGLGTLPGVVGMTVFNSKISIYLRNANIRLFFGTLIIIMALYQLYVTYQKLTGID